MVYKIVLTSTDNKCVAESIARTILADKLSPCIQILPSVESTYIWKKNIEVSNEYLIHIKTIESNIESIKKTIENIHNYDVPEIISVDFSILNSKYINWFNNNIKEGE